MSGIQGFLNPVTIFSTIDATSSTSGSFQVKGGIGIVGSVYAGSLFSSGAAVATQSFVTSSYQPLITAGNGLSKTGDTLSVNAAQTGITSVGTLSGLTITGTATPTINNSAAAGASGTFDTSLNIYKPLLATGEVTIINIGKTSTGNYNFGYIGYHYNGNVSTNSHVTIGLNGANKLLNVYGDGRVVVTSTTTSSSTITGSFQCAGGAGIAGPLYAGSIFSSGLAVATQSFVTSSYQPLITAGTGLSKTGDTLSVNAAQTGITSLGSLTGLTVSGVTLITDTTVSTSTTTGAVQLSGGMGVVGAVYAGSLFSGGAAVATQTFVSTTYQPLITAGTGLSKTGDTLSVNAAQTGITSLGSLTGLTVSGVTLITNTTVSTSTSTGAVQISGGMGVVGAVYAGSLFSGGAAVATQTFVSTSYQPLITAGTGLTKTVNTLSVNAAQTGITSLGTLTGLTVSGVTLITNSTVSTSTSTGAIQVTGGMGVAGAVYAGSLFSGGSAVATQAFVTTSYQPIITAGTGLSKTGDTLSVNAAQTGITSLGTLTGLTVTGATIPLQVNNSSAAGASGSYIAAASLYKAAMTSGETVVVNLGNAASGNYNSGYLGYSYNGSASTNSFVTIGLTGANRLLNIYGDGRVVVTVTTTSSSTTTGAFQCAGGAGIAGPLYAGSIFSGGAAVATQAFVSTSYQPIITAGTGLSKTGDTLSVNAAQPGITSVGTLAGLSVTGALDVSEAFNLGDTTIMSNGTIELGTRRTVDGGIHIDFCTAVGNDYNFRIRRESGFNGTLYLGHTGSGTITLDSTSPVIFTNTTVSTSTTTGSLTLGGGLGVSGALYASTMFLGGAAVATQSFVTTSYQPLITAGTGLTKTGVTLSVNAAQTGITSVGTLTGLTVSGAPSITNSTVSTSTITGALKVAGGLGVVGAVYAGSMFSGGAAVATQTFVTNSYQPLITAGTGLSKTGDTLSVNAAQSGITSVGSLSGLTVTGLANFGDSVFYPDGVLELGQSRTSDGGCHIDFITTVGHDYNFRIRRETGANGNVYIGQTGIGTITLDSVSSIIMTSTAASTSSTTGSLIVRGGLGVAGSINAGASTYTSSSTLPLQVVNTAAAAGAVWSGLSTMFKAAMGVSESVSLVIGKDSSILNCGYVGYQNVGNGVVGNSLTFGLGGADRILNVYGDRSVEVDGRLKVGPVYLSATAAPPHTQGTHITWNRALRGETVFANQLGFGTGGFEWQNFDNTNTLVNTGMVLSHAGNLTVNGQTIVNGGSIEIRTGVANTAAFTTFNNNNQTVNKWIIGMQTTNNFQIYNQAGTGVYLTSGATAWTASSDKRLKRDISEIDDTIALSLISELRPVTFRWNSETDDDQPVHPGFIAQDVEQVLDGVVDNSGEYLGLRVVEMIPYIVGALKELAKKNADLRDEVSMLKKLMSTNE